MNEDLHIGEVWRKPGPFDWCKIESNETPEAPNYDGGLPGFGVRFGKFSNKTKRVHWRLMRYFIAVKTYAEFVERMRAEWRYPMVGKMSEQKNEMLQVLNKGERGEGN